MAHRSMTAKEADKRAMRDGSHALLNKVVEARTCGCDILGAGNLPSPIRIVFCKTHAAAPKMLEVLENTEAELATALPFLSPGDPKSGLRLLKKHISAVVDKAEGRTE